MPKCRHCGNKFKAQVFNQKICFDNDECLKVAKTLALEKSWKKEKATLKKDLLTRSDYLKIAQQVFNAFIRKRDEHLACISCGTFTGKINAGHYRSVGSCPELRFNEFNCHKQCEKCNSYLSGNAGEYRRRLVKKIGINRVEWLESQTKSVKYDRDYLVRIKSIFNKRANRILKKI